MSSFSHRNEISQSKDKQQVINIFRKFQFLPALRRGCGLLSDECWVLTVTPTEQRQDEVSRITLRY